VGKKLAGRSGILTIFYDRKLGATNLQCVYDFCETIVRTELTRCLKLRSSVVVANEVVKKSGVFKVESCKTFESSRTKLSLYAKIRPYRFYNKFIH
jgi:hypothetical protein